MFSLVYRATHHYIIIPSAKYSLNVLTETKSLPKIVQGLWKSWWRVLQDFILGLLVLRSLRYPPYGL